MEIDIILTHGGMVDTDFNRAFPFSSPKPGLAATIISLESLNQYTPNIKFE